MVTCPAPCHFPRTPTDLVLPTGDARDPDLTVCIPDLYLEAVNRAGRANELNLHLWTAKGNRISIMWANVQTSVRFMTAACRTEAINAVTGQSFQSRTSGKDSVCGQRGGGVAHQLHDASACTQVLRQRRALSTACPMPDNNTLPPSAFSGDCCQTLNFEARTPGLEPSIWGHGRHHMFANCVTSDCLLELLPAPARSQTPFRRST